MVKRRAVEDHPPQGAAPKVRAGKICSPKHRAHEVRTGQVRPLEVGVHEARSHEPAALEVLAGKVRAIEVAPVEVCPRPELAASIPPVTTVRRDRRASVGGRAGVRCPARSAARLHHESLNTPVSPGPPDATRSHLARRDVRAGSASGSSRRDGVAATTDATTRRLAPAWRTAAGPSSGQHRGEHDERTDDHNGDHDVETTSPGLAPDLGDQHGRPLWKARHLAGGALDGRQHSDPPATLSGTRVP